MIKTVRRVGVYFYRPDSKIRIPGLYNTQFACENVGGM